MCSIYPIFAIQQIICTAIKWLTIGIISAENGQLHFSATVRCCDEAALQHCMDNRYLAPNIELTINTTVDYISV